LSIAHRRTKLILAQIEALVADGRTDFRPGDIASRLRQLNQPLGVWEIRGALSQLEREGAIEADPASGMWRVQQQAPRKAG